MLNLLACILGTLIGLLSAIPGVHVSVLLIGLLPALGIAGDFGACLITSAMASGVVAATLSKTFHPATRETLKSATPEVVMAYRGEGLKAVDIQLQGVWVGISVVLFVTAPLFLMQLAAPDAPKWIFERVITPVTPVIVLAYVVSTLWPAHNKLATLAVIIAGTLIGYVGLNHPSQPSSEGMLGALLGGAFGISTLVMVLWHRGRITPLPKQALTSAPTHLAGWLGLGAVAGMSTAVTSGIGSGAVVSGFAGHIPEEQYLGMQSASETANNAFAVLMFVLIGAAHSGSAVAIGRAAVQPDFFLALMLIVCILVGVALATQFIQKGAHRYVLCVAKVPQRTTAGIVLLLTVALITHEAGVLGLGVAAVAAALGVVARTQCVPNQALASVLTGPILVYHAGLSPWLASVLGIVH